jgi:hypothetical protein
MKDQGSAFPYTKGLWLLSNLVASISPDDLDALDESVPFSKYTLDNLLGRTHFPEEYRYYFDRNPHGKYYAAYYDRLATEQNHSRYIIPADVKEQVAKELVHEALLESNSDDGVLDQTNHAPGSSNDSCCVLM